MPSTLTVICEEAFRDTAIKEINVPEGVSYLGEHAFSLCKQLEKVILPSTLKEIEYDVFKNSEIKELIVPNKEIKNLVPEEFRDKCVIKNNEQTKLQILHDEYKVQKEKETNRDNSQVQTIEHDRG